jgi:hypothetical protein
LALLIGGVAGSSAPAAGAVGSYYASAAAWALNATWSFGGDKLDWTALLVLAAGVIGVIAPLSLQIYKRVRAWLSSKDSTAAPQITTKMMLDYLNFYGLRRSLICIGAVLFVAFVINFVRYPPIHEAMLQVRPHILGISATFTMFDAFQRANLKVPGGWNIIFTRASEESGQIQGNLMIILQRALGEREVHFLELPNHSVNLDAPRFPEPSEQPGITIHGSNALAQALLALGSCFSTRITTKTVDGLEQFYGVQNLVWIEIGKGSPWSSDLACSG